MLVEATGLTVTRATAVAARPELPEPAPEGLSPTVQARLDQARDELHGRAWVAMWERYLREATEMDLRVERPTGERQDYVNVYPPEVKGLRRSRVASLHLRSGRLWLPDVDHSEVAKGTAWDRFEPTFNHEGAGRTPVPYGVSCDLTDDVAVSQAVGLTLAVLGRRLSRTHVLRLTRAVAESLRPGEWTTYGVVSTIVFGHTKGARAIGQITAADDTFPNAHRVLNAGGTVPDSSFREPGRDWKAECAAALKAEGVTVTAGRADPACEADRSNLEIRARERVMA
jgi:alkylated DNA nucleotide flippase Atl1